MLNQDIAPAAFGERLRALREPLTLDEIAKATGIPKDTLSRWERGAVEKPNFAEVVALGKVYGLRPDEMAALAGIYQLDEEPSEAPVVDGLVNQMRQFLLDLDESQRGLMVDLFTQLMRTQRSRARELRADDAKAVLPAWVRRRLVSGAA